MLDDDVHQDFASFINDHPIPEELVEMILLFGQMRNEGMGEQEAVEQMMHEVSARELSREIYDD
ncbi:MAG: hypothetical protein GWN30_20620 [Gammaproteobacteria bacterium]|nr:hypothetical protein [Gammaproteobacteria bacterium]NIX00622.1 hypothetical protein [Phycisphaerae bacterium]